MKKKFILGGVSFVAFLVLAALLLKVDVAAVGPNGSMIGLSSLNKAVFEFFGESNFWDKITDGFLAISLGIALVFVLIGIRQLIKRKSIAKIDKELFALAGLYVVMAILYVFFEKVAINYRPIFESDGTLEPSFPSTHTLASCVLAGSAALVMRKYVRNERACKLLRFACVGIMIVTPIGRILAGKHWITDVFGGYLLSSALLFTFWGTLALLCNPKTAKK